MGAAGGFSGFRERLSNSRPLPGGATWAASRALRFASRRGGHRSVSVPRFAPLLLPMPCWRSGGALWVPQASLQWDEDLAQGFVGHIRRRWERGKVVRGVTFCPHPGNQSHTAFGEFEIRAVLDVPTTHSPCVHWRRCAGWCSLCLRLWALKKDFASGVRKHSTCSGLVPCRASGNLGCLSRRTRVGARNRVSRSCKPRVPRCCP